MTDRQLDPEAQLQYDSLTYLFKSTLADCDAEDAIDTLDALLDAHETQLRQDITTKDPVASFLHDATRIAALPGDSAKLRALEAAGVQDWDGYSAAMSILAAPAHNEPAE